MSVSEISTHLDFCTVLAVLFLLFLSHKKAAAFDGLLYFNRKSTLVSLWQLRNRIYEQHMDYLRWLKDIHELESWMQLKEEDVHSRDYGSSLDELDKLMIKQLEMEEALQHKELKVSDIKRITLIESEFRALKEKEEEAR